MSKGNEAGSLGVNLWKGGHALGISFLISRMGILIVLPSWGG